jgi:adenylylsulfate kinase-like enzyme
MSTNIEWQSFKLTEANRAKIKKHLPLCLGMTGISSAEKSTLANAYVEKLNSFGKYTYGFIGGNPRHGLNQRVNGKKINLTFDNEH